MVKEANLKGVKFDKVNPDLANPRNEGKAQNSPYTKEEADRWIKEYEEGSSIGRSIKKIEIQEKT